ncbi:MAG: thioesterase family protein [Acidimicrobiales bacterium]|nr:thioesterase family protein [Acidimicrobiales bacterium]
MPNSFDLSGAGAALYAFDGDRYLPGPLTVGPWSPDAQHGGPVAALLAGAAEAAIDPVFPGIEVQTVRLTVELIRPVPLTPLEVTASVVRPGKKVQLVEVTLRAGPDPGQDVARARGLRIRREAMDVPIDRTPPVAPRPELQDGNDETEERGGPRTAFAEAMDLRFVKGSWEELGPVTMWTRLKVPVIEGQEPSALQRAVAAADFGNGVSRVLDIERHLFINPDLTVALARVPDGEWLCFDVVSRLSPEGYGQAESQIFDSAGPIGRAVQSLLVEER